MTLVVKEPGNVLSKNKNIPFKYCYIFDFSVGKIYRLRIPDKIVNNFQLEEYLEEEYGFKLSNIEYMTTAKAERIKILDTRVYISKPKSLKK